MPIKPQYKAAVCSFSHCGGGGDLLINRSDIVKFFGTCKCQNFIVKLYKLFSHHEKESFRQNFL